MLRYPRSTDSMQVEPDHRAPFWSQGAYYSPRLRGKYDRHTTMAASGDEAEYNVRIGYYPSLDQYTRRTLNSLMHGHSSMKLAHGWPQVIRGPMAWHPQDFMDDKPFVLQLSSEQLADLHSALQKCKELNLRPDKVLPTTFALPSMVETLKLAKHMIHQGVGGCILRGLDAAQYSREELITILLGVSSHIAAKRGMQAHDGQMIKHVRDTPFDDAKIEMPFHTDVTCDIVALLTVDAAAEGGCSTFASSQRVYNVLAASRPDLIEVLAKEDWHFDTFGRDPPFYKRAVLYLVEGKPIFSFSRRLLAGGPHEDRSLDIPGLTERQAEALDAIHFIAGENHIKLPMERGDIRLFNNYHLLHARDAFTNADTNQDWGKRYLIRLWLSDPDTKPEFPSSLQLVWDRVFDDDDRSKLWNIDPTPEPDPKGDSPPCD